MSLPTLPGGNDNAFSNKDENKKINNKSPSGGVGPKLPKVSLPNLDSLELGSVANDEDFERNEEPTGLHGLPSMVDDDYEEKLDTFEDVNKEFEDEEENFEDFSEREEEFENESELNSAGPGETEEDFEDFVEINEDFVKTNEDFVEINEDDSEFEEDFEDFVETNEDDSEFDEFEDDFGFLPTVDFEEELEDILPGVNFEENEPQKDEKKKANKLKKNKGFKELDDESVKEFFINLKNKLFKKKEKGERDKSKKPKIKRQKPKQDKPEKQMPKINIKNLFKLKSLMYIIIIVVSIGFILFLFNTFIMSYKQLEEMSIDIKENESIVHFENFSYNDDNTITFKATNKGDMSTDFFIDVVIKTKGSNPFKGEEFLCKSDIIALESAGQVEELLKCDNFEEDLEYKIDIELIEIK